MAKRILCVCKGNTCRSPMFEFLLRDRLQKVGRNDIVVESAGILPEASGQTGNEKSMVCMDRAGLDLRDHRSRYLGNVDLAGVSMIYCMEPGILDVVTANLFGVAKLPTRVILVNPPDGIPNPFQQDQVAYDECYNVISRVVDELVAAL